MTKKAMSLTDSHQCRPPDQALTSAERVMQRQIERASSFSVELAAAASDGCLEVTEPQTSSNPEVEAQRARAATRDVRLGRRLLAHLLSSSSTRKGGKAEQMGFFAGD